MSGADTHARCFVALGSNLGDREAHLRDAADRLDALPGTRVRNVSPVYETEPWGFTEQDDFLNCVAELATTLDARALLAACKEIERAMGRTEAPRNHPRIIDIDVLLRGSDVIDGEGITIPHPRLAQRRFVLAPLCDLAPDLRHPLLRSTMLDLLASCPDMGRIRKSRIFPR